ncbi:hypothetical protein SGFS_064410 [Streptomyces graminofaciens]|uniref:Uncharacterized protein n=1 Tax=Streptomyces graminofaciens TaxID=68212 RepID=A0ABM7FFH4_9ACTN|nr:hypothetical protein SGFS_064410 [Streptomyces graminofaciens]
MRPDHPLLLHSASAPTRAVCAPQPGFWCEWRHADGRLIRSASQRTPESAVRWARITLRVIASAVDEDFVDPLMARSHQGWRDAVRALAEGGEFALPLVAKPYSFVWHVRPVPFLTLVGGSPMPHIPEGDPPWE